jgi:LAS superfamily LD-carboxypeptidase LdcB
MRFPWDEAIAFDRAILDLSARLGRRIDRTEAIRGLARLFVADERVAERALDAVAEASRETGAEQEHTSGRRPDRDTGLSGL